MGANGKAKDGRNGSGRRPIPRSLRDVMEETKKEGDGRETFLRNVYEAAEHDPRGTVDILGDAVDAAQADRHASGRLGKIAKRT